MIAFSGRIIRLSFSFLRVIFDYRHVRCERKGSPTEIIFVRTNYFSLKKKIITMLVAKRSLVVATSCTSGSQRRLLDIMGQWGSRTLSAGESRFWRFRQRVGPISLG